MILQTGGLASGDISTRSSPRRCAMSRAASVGMMPSWAPSSLMTRTSGTRMALLIRTLSFSGAMSRQRRLRNPTRHDLLLDSTAECVHGNGLLSLGMPPAHRHRTIGLLPIAHDQHVRDLLGLGAAHAIAQRL